jgi:hypothetical protein
MKKIEWLKGEKKWISNNSEKFSVLLKFSQNSLCMWVSESDIVMEEGRKKSAVRVSEWVNAKWEVRERESEGGYKTSAVCTGLLPSTIACLILSSISL